MITDEAGSAPSETAREISRGMVALYKEYTGRGPSYARSYVHEDLVVVVLSDTMTPAELTLRDEDRAELVRDQRRVFQDVFRERAIAIAEGVTGRTVLAFLSDHAVDTDHAIEVFVLEPAA